MIAMLRQRLAAQDGQTFVFFVVLLGGLMLMLALVLDVGSWLQAQRRAQSVADAAALAGVQELPWQPGTSSPPTGAYAVAGNYASSNWPGVDTSGTTVAPTNDEITVVAKRSDVPASST
jgi:Flp pilus assembly protein TadG